MCVFMLRQDKGMRLTPRGVDNDMWEWISGVDQWNKATHVNLVVSRVNEENSTRSMTKLLLVKHLGHKKSFTLENDEQVY